MEMFSHFPVIDTGSRCTAAIYLVLNMINSYSGDNQEEFLCFPTLMSPPSEVSGRPLGIIQTVIL